MNEEDNQFANLSEDEDNDALIFHILITEPLTKLKSVPQIPEKYIL